MLSSVWPARLRRGSPQRLPSLCARSCDHQRRGDCFLPRRRHRAVHSRTSLPHTGPPDERHLQQASLVRHARADADEVPLVGDGHGPHRRAYHAHRQKERRN